MILCNIKIVTIVWDKPAASAFRTVKDEEYEDGQIRMFWNVENLLQ
jgi:hypothetical protein